MLKPKILPIGIGDLKVVKQKLIRYEEGEIAHIENIMASESRSREHRRSRQVEEFFSTEVERTEENLKDLQSTERFELQQETQKTLKSDTKFEAGVEVSGGFGPVKMSAYAKYASSSSSTESERNATNYAKDVTERSLNRIVEKIREERTVRTLEEFEEINKHSFDNANGGHTSGIYRWVDKYYRAKVVNYGKRLMYEFIVPEPAAFFIFAKKYHLQNSILPEKPEAPTDPDFTDKPLSPGDISRENYLVFVRDYDVHGVSPPPPENIVLAKAISKEFQPERSFSFSDEGFTVPKGYLAKIGAYIITSVYPEGGFSSLSLHIGLHRISIGKYPSPLFFQNEKNIVPISGTGNALSGFSINIDLLCTLSDEAFKKWQLDTYSAVMNAYTKQLLDYEEKLSSIEIQDGVQIGGRNPLINREIEREELKKSCLTLWANDRFDNAPAISHSTSSSIPRNYPEIDQVNAINNIDKIQFFEQAFDWKNIVYEFYPYNWGRKKHWLDNYSAEDNDPLFEQFLKAGAARVVVPVNLAFTSSVLYFQASGMIWSGGDVPALGDPSDTDVALYNSYLEELEGEEVNDDIDKNIEINEDDPDSWLIKVPTKLIWLQPDNIDLPNFE